MTRKCALCKETNYRNSCSFFSAPRDAESRAKWQEALKIPDYVVNEETFVCSRHFLPEDIITHWVSGVPPHVVTIKYKKCRLRPGAVPITNSNFILETYVSPQHANEEGKKEEVQKYTASKHQGNHHKYVKLPISVRKNDNKNRTEGYSMASTAVVGTDSSKHSNNDQEIRDADLEEYLARMEGTTQEELEGQAMEIDNPEPMTAIETIDCLEGQEHEGFESLVEDLENDVNEDHNTEYINSNHSTNDNNLKIVLVDNQKQQKADNKIENENLNEESVEGLNDGLEDTASSAKYDTELDDETIKDVVLDEDDLDLFEPVYDENQSNDDSQEFENENEEDDIDSENSVDPLDVSKESNDGANPSMLFEDLLEIYNEVNLPRSWTPMVISGGKTTTIIYVCMKLTQTGIPYIQKQIYIKYDMILQCSAGGICLNTKFHNLTDVKCLKVKSLKDIENFIKEFDKRLICVGALNKITPDEVDNALAYRQDTKWRHIDCSIIIDSGSCCSKCSSLNFASERQKIKNKKFEQDMIIKKNRTIYTLQKLLTKAKKQNEQYESIKDNPKNITAIIDQLTIPDAQKIMIKECINGDSNNSNNETWIFLSLLIYIESPRVYKYLLNNKFINLPEIKTMRHYLHLIRTDGDSYKLFQKTVEPFQ